MALNQRFARTGSSRGLDRLVSVLTPQNSLYEIEYFLAKVRSFNAQKEPNQAMSTPKPPQAFALTTSPPLLAPQQVGAAGSGQPMRSHAHTSVQVLL
jgi:hypothetical protein